MVEPSPFVHLHVHSNFSFGDGACRIDELLQAAAAANMSAVACTDHDGLYGAVRFYKACRQAGVKPIVGVELNVESVLAVAAHRKRNEVAGGQSAAPLLAIGEALKRARYAWRAGGADDSATVNGPLRGQTAAPGYHLVLLAKDYQGWSNLCQIISAAHLEHPGEPAWARWQTIAAHSGHLIALSACRRGELGQAVLAALRGEKGARERARRIAAFYSEAFAPDEAQGQPSRDGRGRRSDAALARTANYFIELQHELRADSHDYIRELNLIARELRIPTVATNNVHYVTQAQAPLHDVLAAEAANQPLPNPLGRKNAELYFKSAAQMRRLFFPIPEAVENTVHIARRCNLDLGLGRLRFPAYPLPPGETAYSLLSKLSFAGACERYKPLTGEVSVRLTRELRVIEQLGFAEYFLAVHDIVAFVRSRSIPYSGRGSAGNSIVSYVLRICEADPIEHDLLFERFLNPARREMPDIDIDFCSARRDEIIAYVYERFGDDRVAMVATVNTVHAPSAVRIVAKACGYRPDEVNRLSSTIPWGSAAKLSEMLAERPELHDHEFQHPHYRRLVRLAEQLADYPAHLGTHLGGFILARDPLTDRLPLQWAAKGVIVAQFDKDDVAALGLVKMDLLALKMHSAIAEALRRVKERTGADISPWELPRNDPAVYRLISEARTVGVFQLESSGQRNLATRLKERNFADVIAAISLFRPGPLQAEMIGPFIRRRQGREVATVPHASMWPALKSTYGVIIYQEQVIAVAAAVAGFSLAEGDMLRRAMTHERSLAEMDEIGRHFVEKASANGVEGAVAEEVFRQLRGFAAYGFNKAHAACFAIICNASAWLKAHYPAEFFCGLLNNQPMGFYSPRVVLNDARRWGLDVLPVDVNVSAEGFAVEVTGGRRGTAPCLALRVGLNYVKGMSAATRQRIVAERGDMPRDNLGRPLTDAASAPRPYISLTDFIERTHTNVEISANLVRVGAFDALGRRREELLVQLPLLYARLGRRYERGAGAGRKGRPDTQAAANAGEVLHFVVDDLPALGFLPSESRQDKVRAELEILGLNVSAHPLAFLRAQIRALRVTPFDELPNVPHGRPARLVGVLERAQMPWVRSGHRTLFLTLEDETQLAQVVVFNETYLKYGHLLNDAVYLYVEGVLQNDEEHGLAVVAQRIFDLLAVVDERVDGQASRSKRDDGAAPQDSHPGKSPRRLNLPDVQPRTRPGRSG
ncbi:MAG: DNA polymerase III subunit alpha [Thermoleophilia bacterium]